MAGFLSSSTKLTKTCYQNKRCFLKQKVISCRNSSLSSHERSMKFLKSSLWLVTYISIILLCIWSRTAWPFVVYILLLKSISTGLAVIKFQKLKSEKAEIEKLKAEMEELKGQVSQLQIKVTFR